MKVLVDKDDDVTMDVDVDRSLFDDVVVDDRWLVGRGHVADD